MNRNAYSLIWEDANGEPNICFMSGFTIADVDEQFAKMFPMCDVVAIELLGDYVTVELDEVGE